MITRMLEIKERLVSIYGRYDRYIIPAFKFLFMLITLIIINSNLPGMSSLNNIFIVLMVSLVAAVMPNGAIALFAGTFMGLDILGSSIELGAIVIITLIVLFCMYFRYSPREGYIAVITAVCFALKIPYLIPVIAGLTLSVFSVIPVIIGIYGYYVMKFAVDYDKSLDEMTTTNVMENVRYILNGLFNNRAMIGFCVVFAVIIIIINVIKKFSMDYAWLIAVGVGCVSNIILMIIVNVAFSAGISYLGIIFGNILGALLGIFLYFMVFSADYTRTENVRFEDDDYYYFVKAVPKYSVNRKKLSVQKINSRKLRVTTDKSASAADPEDDSTEIMDL